MLVMERVIMREEAEWRNPLRVPVVAPKKMRAKSAREIV